MGRKLKGEEFLKMIKRGYTPQQAQAELGLSDSAVKQQLEKIKSLTYLYTHYLANVGYLVAHQSVLEDIQYARKEAIDSIEQLKGEIAKGHHKYHYAKIHAISALTAASKEYWAMLNEAPMMETWREHVQETMEGKTPVKQRSASALAFLPDHAN